MADISKIMGVAVANVAKVNDRIKAAGDAVVGVLFPSVGADIYVTSDSFQGVFGEMKEVPEESVTFTGNSFQGVFGEMTYVRDTTV